MELTSYDGVDTGRTDSVRWNIDGRRTGIEGNENSEMMHQRNRRTDSSRLLFRLRDTGAERVTIGSRGASYRARRNGSANHSRGRAEPSATSLVKSEQTFWRRRWLKTREGLSYSSASLINIVMLDARH